MHRCHQLCYGNAVLQGHPGAAKSVRHFWWLSPAAVAVVGCVLLHGCPHVLCCTEFRLGDLGGCPNCDFKVLLKPRPRNLRFQAIIQASFLRPRKHCPHATKNCASGAWYTGQSFEICHVLVHQRWYFIGMVKLDYNLHCSMIHCITCMT